MCLGYKLFQNLNISFEICVNVFTADPNMLIFHWKYVQMCLGPSWILIRILHGSVYGSYMDLYVDLIWVVYMVMCSQLIQNVNISFEICANVSGGTWRSRMDPYQDPTWIPIWILSKSLCGSYMGRLYVNVFTADPKC